MQKNEITFEGRTYRVGDRTPIIRWAQDEKKAYVLKREGLYLVDFDLKEVILVMALSDTDRAEMCMDD